jgi:tetratricopeptide (TPR) repeat protein
VEKLYPDDGQSHPEAEWLKPCRAQRFCMKTLDAIAKEEFMKALSIGLVLIFVSLQTFAQTVQADLPSNDETACLSHDPTISIQACTAVIQLGQATANLATVYVNRGLSYARQGLYSQAIADQTKAIALNPDEAQAYINRGSFYGKTGLYDQDITDQTEAISLSPIPTWPSAIAATPIAPTDCTIGPLPTTPR